MKNEKKLAIQIALKEINIISFSLAKTPSNFKKIKSNNIGHGIGLAHKISLNTNSVFVKVNIDILLRKSIKDKDPKTLGNLNTEFIFKIRNMRNITKRDKNGKIGIPQELFDTFNNISISTTRGILHCKLSDTYLKNHIMPIINPTSFTKNKS